MGFEPDGDYLTKLKAEQLELSDGSVNIAMDVGGSIITKT